MGKRSSLHMLPFSNKTIWVPTLFLLRCSGNRRTRSTPLPGSTAGRSQQASRITWHKQNHFCLLKAVLDGFAAMMGRSQTLPAERFRLWLKESVFNSYNQMLSVVVPLETDCKAWVGHSGSTPRHFPLSPGYFLSNNTLFCYNKLPNSTP